MSEEQNTALIIDGVTLGMIIETDRWDPSYWDPKYKPLDELLNKSGARPLREFITFITYGQVSTRTLNKAGKVRYLQVINIRATGIDFLIKPDRLGEGSHSDTERSRVLKDDLLFTRNSFGGMQTLLGRCLGVHRDYGLVNVSEDIDVIRVTNIDPYYVAAFIKCEYGQLQVQRQKYGVRSTKLNFDQVKDIRIPVLSDPIQADVRSHYLAMAEVHDKAMNRKETLSNKHGCVGDALGDIAKADGPYLKLTEDANRRHNHLLAELERVIRGDAKRLRPYSP